MIKKFRIKRNDWLLADTHVHKQPIIALYFEFENELKFYNLEAWCPKLPDLINGLGFWAKLCIGIFFFRCAETGQLLRDTMNTELSRLKNAMFSMTGSESSDFSYLLKSCEELYHRFMGLLQSFFHRFDFMGPF